MLEPRKFSQLDFLTVALTWGVLVTFFATVGRSETPTIKLPDLPEPVAFIVVEAQPLPFAPVTVKVSPRSPACDCKDCNCLDGCACGTAHKYVGSVDAGIQCLRCWEVKSDPLHTVGDGGSSPPASLAREGVAQRQSPTTYTAAQGRWVRSCGPNGCSQVWQASQPAALPKARQSVQPQRRGLFGWRR
jgi:hypothetical protein